MQPRLAHGLWTASSALLLALPSPAHAQEHDGALHTVPDVPAQGTDPTAARLAEIERVLRDEGPPARRWHRGWPLAFGVLALGQGAAAVVWDEKREMLAVGAVVSAVGGLGRLAIPFAPARADRRLARWPAATAEQRAAKLSEAERLLTRGARVEGLGRTGLPIAGAAVVSGTGAAVLWLGYDERVPALTMLSAGLLLAEVVRETQPHALPAAEVRYTTRWSLAAGPTGVWVHAAF